MEIDVNLGHGVVVPGSSPIVLLGANGAGKTRFGTYIVSTFGYDGVSALRGLSVTEIPMWSPETAKQQTDQVVFQNKSNTSEAAGDLPNLLAELKADESQAATIYRVKALETKGAAGIPPSTRLDVLVRLWGLIFPGREIDLTGYQPKASWTNGLRSPDKYSVASMSDGERSALYLIARILRSPPGVVVVDEPEIHFHSLLARQFWDVLEAEQKNTRFIYITHDLSFALSRKGQIGIVKSPDKVELINDASQIPDDLFENIIGAASLSVVSSRIVLCEGQRDKSVDIAFYGAWFKAPSTVVVPVGTCDQVRRTFATFQGTSIVKNANPIAIVERDFWPDNYLTQLKSEGLFVLPSHEVEGLVSQKSIASAVANHMAISNFDVRYSQFEKAVRSHFVGISVNKVVLERAKRDVDVRILGLPNKAYPEKDLVATKANFISVVNLSRAVPDLGALFDQHAKIVSDCLSATADEFLSILPGKPCLNMLVECLGMKQESYLNLINEALSIEGNDDKIALRPLNQALVAALTPSLPSR